MKEKRNRLTQKQGSGKQGSLLPGKRVDSGSRPVTEEPGRTLKKGQILEITVDVLDREGIGLATTGMRKLLVPGALQGDRCLVKVEHTGRTGDHVRLLKLLEPSPLRTRRPVCRDAADCLGCSLIGMRYEEQLNWKHQLVQSEMNVYPSLKGIKVEHPLAPERRLHYRTTAKLAVAGVHGDPWIGIYRRASHDVVDLGECPLHHPLINRIIAAVREGIKKSKVPIYHPERKTGFLRYLVVRVSESRDQAMVTFVTARRSFNEIHHLAKFLQERIPQVTVVCQNVNSSEGNVIFGPHDHFLTKQHTVQEKIGGVEMLISPRSFLQAQHDGAQLLYGQVLEWAGDISQGSVLDLYCGIGGIALTLAPKAGRVTGIEVSSEAVEDARRNARLNRADNCRFEAVDALEALEELADDGERFDLVVLNPPRKGCDQEVLERVARFKPRRIIYVSCSPRTLARDLDILSRLGYSCSRVQPVDMFPQTPHVENVALLEIR